MAPSVYNLKRKPWKIVRSHNLYVELCVVVWAWLTQIQCSFVKVDRHFLRLMLRTNLGRDGCLEIVGDSGVTWLYVGRSKTSEGGAGISIGRRFFSRRMRRC
jgi:hypothetical protein